jgi:hypothetical protein
MPRQAINYENTIIYKIQHLEDESLLYVGHTTDFTKRKSAHKANLKNTNNKAYNYKVYQMIRDNGGWDMFNMIEIHKFSCLNRREAEAEEDKVMREMKATMNNNRAYTTDEDRKQDSKKYREEHSEIIKEQAKKYREEHVEQTKIYREEHAEQTKIYNKEYKEEHPELIKSLAKKYREKTKAEFEATYTIEKHSELLAKQKIYRDAYKERQKNKSN